MGTTPWRGEDDVIEGADYPVTYVSWEDAQEFCRRLSAQEGKSYGLPTEAEWEYACRAGSTTTYCFRDSESNLGSYAWYGDIPGERGQRHPYEIGLKQVNAWGLHDMHGNAWELCQDWHGFNYYKLSPMHDPAGPSSGLSRVGRGGSLNHGPNFCRSAFSLWNTGRPVRRLGLPCCLFGGVAMQWLWLKARSAPQPRRAKRKAAPSLGRIRGAASPAFSIFNRLPHICVSILYQEIRDSPVRKIHST